MSRKILYVSPAAPATSLAAGAEPRADAAGPWRIGALDNSKANADHLLRFLLDGLATEVPIASTLSVRKAAASGPAGTAALDRLKKEADFVVGAMAD